MPESDIGAHSDMLLEIWKVQILHLTWLGKNFILISWYWLFFGRNFFDGTDEEKQEIVITNLEPKVFKALLHFIYRDTLSEEVESVGSSSASVSPVSETLIAKLLAAADRYCLDRLELMWESFLSKNISVNSVAKILALADEYHAMELKAVCLRFTAENLAAVMRSDGFEYLKENCPSLQSELLKTAAGCKEDCSSGGKSRSVWAQLSDGGDTNVRRVRQRT